MTAELGGFTGLVAPDAARVRFIREHRGEDIVIEDVPMLARRETPAVEFRV